MEQPVFSDALKQLVSPATYKKITDIIASHDYSSMSELDEYADLDTICRGLTTLGVDFEYDICIVR